MRWVILSKTPAKQSPKIHLLKKKIPVCFHRVNTLKSGGLPVHQWRKCGVLKGPNRCGRSTRTKEKTIPAPLWWAMSDTWSFLCSECSASPVAVCVSVPEGTRRRNRDNGRRAHAQQNTDAAQLGEDFKLWTLHYRSTRGPHRDRKVHISAPTVTEHRRLVRVSS